MPPKPNMISGHNPDPENEVVCPIKASDGTNCRKKCLGEKRFRSMQEHIRRAHPEYYIPKLPATKESFELMVNSPPHERVPRLDVWSPTSAPRQPRQQQQQQQLTVVEDQYAVSDPAGSGPIQTDGFFPEAMSPFPDDYRRGSLLPAANAAAALASLHYARPDGPEGAWAGGHEADDDDDDDDQNFFVDHMPDAKRAHFVDPTLGPDQQFLDSQYQQPQEPPPPPPEDTTPGLLPSSMIKSPSARNNTLPPVPRSASRPNRPRKSSLTQSARKAKHERHKAKGHFNNTSHDRKALSAEPNMYGKRWEDLIDAATSATEEDSRDLTPIPVSPYRSPPVQSRTSLPPFALGSQFQSYTASPLQQTLTPPPADDVPNPLDMHPFPSVENETAPSSIDSAQSGTNFHIMPSNASDSSPMFSNPVKIYCAGCRRLSVLRESYACPECICGLCPGCVQTLIGEQNRGRIAQCPSCRTMGGRFKKFNLDLR